MEGVLWHVLASTRGGPTRARILRTIDERPQNANQLAEELGLDYTTVRYHLDRLGEDGVVTASGGDYGKVYLPSERVRKHWDTVEEILAVVEDEDGESLDSS